MDAGSRTPTTSFSIASMVRGYHIYKDIWDALIGEELSCEREGANYADPFAVAIIKDDNVVGHEELLVCSLIYKINLTPRGYQLCHYLHCRTDVTVET